MSAVTPCSYVMGIDGGGSTVRVVIATPELAVCGQASGPTANPSVVGRDAAAETIRAAMRGALEDAGLLQLARQSAMRVLDEDPELLEPRHAAIAGVMRERKDQVVWGRIS